MAGDELARVMVEFPHLAGDDPQGLARVLEGARKSMSDSECEALETRFRDIEARLAEAQSNIARHPGDPDGPSWNEVWATATALPFEGRGYDDPTQLASLSRWLPPWQEVTDDDGDWMLSDPLSEDHLCIGLAAIAELAGFFARPVTTLDPSDPAQRPRIGRTLRDIADLAHSLLLWFEAGEEAATE